jgi:serine/threonine protein kinase
MQPENMLFKDNSVDAELKIMDFGLAKLVDPDGKNTAAATMTTQCGSPTYYAPEVMTASQGHGYDCKCDVWSLAVIMYIMLCGLPPFWDEDGADIKAGRYSYEFEEPTTWPDVSSDAKDLIDKCLVVNPANRLDMHEFLAHPWMANNNETKLDVNEKLNKFVQSRRRWKNAINAVRFQNFMKMGLSAKSEEEPSSEEGSK